MASSGSFNTSGYSASDGSIYLTFSWKTKSVSVEQNKTTIEWTLTGGGTSDQWFQTGNIKVYIGGNIVYTKSGTINLIAYPESDSDPNTVETYKVASGTYTISHATDGTGSFTASVKAGIYYYTGENAKGEKTFTLDPIARASQPSCITYPNHTQNVGKFGDTISIHMNRNSSSFTHKVRYAFGSLSGTCINADTGSAATAITTGFKWKIPLEFMEKIPNTTSGSGTIYVDTYNGSTLIGTKWCGFTATISDDASPGLSVTIDDVDGIDDIYGSPVQNLSRIKVTPIATTKYGATVKSCVITVDGVTHTKASAVAVTSGYLKYSGNSAVKVVLTDSRGLKKEYSYTMSVKTYSAPSISKLTVGRCDEDGNADPNGDHVKVTFSASISNVGSTNKNTATYMLSYKKTSASSYTNASFSDVEGKYSVTDLSVVFPADVDSVYDVKITASDKHRSATRSTSASTAFELINYGKDGTCLGFGARPKDSNSMRIGLVTIKEKNEYCYSSIGKAETDGYVLMARITITATNADTPMTFVFSRRKAAATMTVHILFNATGDLVPQPKSVRYEGDNYGAFLVDKGNSVWELYVQKANASDTVTLNRWHTSYRQMKRVSVEFPTSDTIITSVPSPYWRATPLVAQSIIDCFMPVGFILTLYTHNDPNDMYPGTTWVRIENAFLWGCDKSGTIGQTGGEKTHLLTADEMPSHSHGAVYSGNAMGDKTLPWLSTSVLGTGDKIGYSAVSTGGSKAHNNMPPYVQVSIWRRTA